MHRIKTYKMDSISILIYLLLVFLGCLSIYSSSFNPSIDTYFLSLNTIIGRQLLFVFTFDCIHTTLFNVSGLSVLEHQPILR